LREHNTAFVNIRPPKMRIPPLIARRKVRERKRPESLILLCRITNAGKWMRWQSQVLRRFTDQPGAIAAMPVERVASSSPNRFVRIKQSINGATVSSTAQRFLRWRFSSNSLFPSGFLEHNTVAYRVKDRGFACSFERLRGSCETGHWAKIRIGSISIVTAKPLIFFENDNTSGRNVKQRLSVRHVISWFLDKSERFCYVQ
jgi:hypothetical protein